MMESQASCVVESPADEQPGKAGTSSAVPSPPATSSALLNHGSLANNTVMTAAAAPPSLASATANVQQGFAQVNRAQSDIATATAGGNVNNTNFLGSLLSGLGGTMTGQQRQASAQPALQSQNSRLQQRLLLHQRMLQHAPSSGVAGLLQEQTSAVQALQQLMNDQQQPPSSFDIAAAVAPQPAPHNGSLSQVYSRLINQQVSQPLGNAIGMLQAANQNTLVILQLQHLLGQQSDQQQSANNSSNGRG